MKRKTASILCLATTLGLLLSGCGGGGDPAPEKKIKEVVATTTMVADMVRAIAGDDLKVIAMMAPGVDPHGYEPTARVITNLRVADLIVHNGMHLEGKMTETFENQGDRALAITDHLPKDRLISAESIGEEYGDPHVWGDAGLWALAIPAVVEKLSALVPEKKTEFETRGQAYQDEIEQLHAWIESRIAEIPEEQRILITSHDAFNYFGRAYGVAVYGIQGISTVDEPSVKSVTDAVDLIKGKGVKAIFPESSVSPDVIERISKDSGAAIGDTLFSDSCGALGKMETKNGETYDLGTYIGMMKHNVNAMVDVLK